MNRLKTSATRLIGVVLCILLLFSATFVSAGNLEESYDNTARFLVEQHAKPEVSSIGGEWTIIGLARGGAVVPKGYYEGYVTRLKEKLKETGGILHEKKYTEYSRVILAVTALGLDARKLGGYDLTAPLADFEKTVWQGINGPIWALIALDSGNYPIPKLPGEGKQATRQAYVEEILSYQLKDGGFSLQKDGEADADITAMAIQALANYREQTAVKKALEKALSCLASLQNEKGGFTVFESTASESIGQSIVALSAMDISLEDPRFVKQGNSLLDALMSYALPDGGFAHSLQDKEHSAMATEQALYTLAALKREQSRQNDLYEMSDAKLLVDQENTGVKPHLDIAVPRKQSAVSFSDIAFHAEKTAIEELAGRRIVGGMTENEFAPEGQLTRAQFSAIIVRALGLPAKEGIAFADVKAGAWYEQSVQTASAYGLVGGVGEGMFAPEKAITRAEAAVMIGRAGVLCGLSLPEKESAIFTLSQFTDYRNAPEWAVSALAFCYGHDLLSDEEMEIGFGQVITRGEMAGMTARLLAAAHLL